MIKIELNDEHGYDLICDSFEHAIAMAKNDVK